MNIVVQKFGGTSVATDASREMVIQKVIAAKNEQELPVVVVSAIGRKGSPYATDTLLDFVSTHAGSITDREYDLLLSCGEIISAVVIATLLNHNGYKAKALTGGQAGIITDKNHKNADLVYTHTDPILACLEQDIIPVVAGFQGVTADGEVTTLGRGGSDTTAALLAASLKADRIEIYTDVNGIMTADPRVCEKARIIPAISYNEVFQMADSGAKVIHPRAVEYAMRSQIPLIIKNTFTDEKGTCITQTKIDTSQKECDHIITSIAHRNDRVQFTIQENELSGKHLLELIAEKDISIDLINIFPQYKVFTIDNQHQASLELLLKDNSYQYTLVEDCAKVTVIGERMTGIPGVMARIVKALQKTHIEILQTADSLTTIGCLIRQENVSGAISALHDEFLL